MILNFAAEMKNHPHKAKIAIMGAGALGSVIGGMLARQGHKVALIDRRPRPKKSLSDSFQFSIDK